MECPFLGYILLDIVPLFSVLKDYTSVDLPVREILALRGCPYLSSVAREKATTNSPSREAINFLNFNASFPYKDEITAWSENFDDIENEEVPIELDTSFFP